MLAPLVITMTPGERRRFIKRLSTLELPMESKEGVFLYRLPKSQWSARERRFQAWLEKMRKKSCQKNPK